MKLRISMMTATLLVMASFAQAEDIKSGLQAGEFVGPFFVTKLAGANNDGVKIGMPLCYRCKNGRRPQVIVFTRSADAKVVELVKRLDAVLEKNSKQQLRAFVNYLGADKNAAANSAKQLAKESEAKNVPFVVPYEFENGPVDYSLNAKAEVTIILAGGGEVKANHAFSSAKELNVKDVIADIAKILN